MKAPGLISRFLACLLLVAATWNPTGYCYIDWIGGDQSLAVQAAATALLLTLHIMAIRITVLSLGAFGLSFILAMLFAAVFALSELGVLDLWQRRIWGYVGVTIAASVLTAGLVWSLFKRRVTGQSNYLNPPP